MHRISGRKWLRAVLVAVVLLVSLPAAALAAWSTSPTVNNPISTASGNQENPQIVSDGSGGFIITWQDYRVTLSGIGKVVPVGVGGEIAPIDRGSVLALWLGLAAILALAVGAGGFALRWRRTHRA